MRPWSPRLLRLLCRQRPFRIYPCQTEPAGVRGVTEIKLIYI